MDEQSKKEVVEPDSIRTPSTRVPGQTGQRDDHRTTRYYRFKHCNQKHKNFLALYPDPLTRPPFPAEPWSFTSLYSFSPSDTKLTCCDFSSDGMFLAIGGHEKRVLLYDMNKCKSTKMMIKHANVITDLRFSPNSTMFATSSLDRTVLLWDTTKSDYTAKIEGNNGPVLSLDFCEGVKNYMSVCDSSEDIKFFAANFSEPRLYHTMKACVQTGSKQVRFQTKAGRLLAVASGMTIDVIFHDMFKSIHKFEGEEEFRSICWSLCGSYIGSVTKNRAQFWCLCTRACLSELKSNGEDFESCCIHPRFGGSTFMIIGCSKSVIYWNPHDTFTHALDDHTDVVSCLTSCSTTNMIASASHDHTVKIWY